MKDDVSEDSRRSIEVGSKSFAAAARLFDPATRESARLFYNWCRHCDDVVDGQAAGHGRIDRGLSAADRLSDLETQTRSALAGEPQKEPAFAALQRVADRHAIPEHLPFDILNGFRQDVEGRRYVAVDDLMSYCYGVAGAVGVTMAIIMGIRPEERDTLDRACDLGIAFQLTNISRDVMDDAEVGRVYLPDALFGGRRLSPDEVRDPGNRQAVIAATHALLELAERYYASARVGIARLPWRSGWAVATARGVYREIGKRVRGVSDPWAERQSVPRRRKLWHVTLGTGAPLAYGLLGDPPRPGLWTRDRLPPSVRQAAADPR